MSSKRTSKNANDRVTAYAELVVDGIIPAGQWVVSACKRHLKDLRSKNKGFYFDVEAADHAIDFFRFLRHSKGEWGMGGGVTFELEPWQQFIVGSIFGWRRTDGLRRFRTVYIEVPRKNGKSTMLAGIGLYLFLADNEPGAEIYTAATKKDQAKITHAEAMSMVQKSPPLRKRVQSFKDNLHIRGTMSKFMPLGADSDTLDGLNVHAALVDELHAHRNRKLWDVLDTATGARRQPLMIAITTAGFDQSSFCFEQHEYAEKIMNGTAQDETFFTYVAAPDPGDDPYSVTTWKKSNPNFGVSVKEDDLRRLADQAKEMPSALNNFLTKRLNVWTQQADRWIDLAMWDRNDPNPAEWRNEEQLRGRKGYAGLDLASVSDITAALYVFPRGEDPQALDLVARFWCPESRLTDRRNRYADQYRVWASQGWLQTTPGDAVDYEFVKAQILKDAEMFAIQELSIDRLFQGYQLAMELEQEGLTVTTMGMGFLSMAAPMQEMERRLRMEKIKHAGNPVLRWMADNLSVKRDPAGNLKPDKATSQGKIDGIVAFLLALDRAMRHEDKTSVYERRGLASL